MYRDTVLHKLLWILMLFTFSQMSVATEYISQEAPTPESASKPEEVFDHTFQKNPLSEKLLMKDLKKRLKSAQPFWRDTKLSADLRSFNFDRRNSSTDTREAWAAGGRLSYESGLWKNFSVSAAYYNSSKISAPSDSGPTGLLEPRQNNISVIAEANLRYRFTTTFLEGSEIRLYRQALDIPYINGDDIRMLPITHEGYTIKRSNSSLDYIAGHITKIKKRDSEKFVHMSEAAGAQGSDKGLTMAGALIPVNEQFTIGATNYYGWDTFNTFFAKATYRKAIKDDLDMELSGQFTDQRSVGEELVGDFSTNLLAAQASFDWHGVIIKTAASVTGDDSDIRVPWGESPSYLSLQRLDFHRANEKAILLGVSYNTGFFSSLGLSGFINIARGVDAKSPVSGEDRPDQNEYDITLDYKPPGELFKGLGIRARAAFIDIDGDGNNWNDIRDYRLIVNYSIPLL